MIPDMALYSHLVQSVLGFLLNICRSLEIKNIFNTVWPRQYFDTVDFQPQLYTEELTIGRTGFAQVECLA